MEASLVQPTARTRTPLSALTKLTMAALIGVALALAYLQLVVISHFRPDLTVFAVVMAIVAGICATGWRWAPLLGALLSILVVVGNLKGVVHDITHPESFHLFAFIVVALALAVVGMIAGISAGVQNYRSRERNAPRIMAPALATLAALCLGAILSAAIPRQSGVGISTEALASLPAITTPAFRFDQKEIRVKAGAVVAFRLDNLHNAPHSFDIDELNVHASMPVGQSAVALFTPTKPGTYTFYCSLPGHRAAGMQGSLIVEP